MESKPKRCPWTGGDCTYRETCENGMNVIDCWLIHCKKVSEPESRDTGLHRDSMG